MPGRICRKPAASGRQPDVQDEQRHDQRQDGDAVAGVEQQAFVALDEERNVAARRFQHQRTEHDQERHRERREGGDQRVADRFQPQPVPRAAARPPNRRGSAQRAAPRRRSRRNTPRAPRRWSGCRRASWSARRGFRPTGRPRPVAARPAAAVPRPVGEFLGAEEAGQRGQHDQEREQRHQRRQRDVAGDRPAVIGEECVKRVHHDVVDVAKLPSHPT